MKEQINRIEAEEARQRLGKLKEKDILCEDSVRDIASKEDKFREILKNKGLDKGAVDELADIYSDEVLEKFEANKERWTDELTGLRNWKALNEEVPQLLSAGKRLNMNCSFLKIDFDFLQEVNDEFGHSAGDQALKKIAQIIKSQVRTADTLYRYGGDEFVVFLFNTVSEKAAELAERIRVAVNQTEVELIDGKGQKQHLKKTVSVGCVSTDQLKEWSSYTEKEAKNFIELIIDDADRALLNAKQSGKNRTIIYDKNLEALADGEN